MKLNITVSKTANGLSDYIQIMSDDTVSVNVVLVAESIVINDTRPPARKSASKARAVVEK